MEKETKKTLISERFSWAIMLMGEVNVWKTKEKRGTEVTFY